MAYEKRKKKIANTLVLFSQHLKRKKNSEYNSVVFKTLKIANTLVNTLKKAKGAVGEGGNATGVVVEVVVEVVGTGITSNLISYRSTGTGTIYRG